MATVGFIGLGIMGRPMLKNLLKAGHKVVAYGRNPKKLEACVSDGAERAASNRDVGSRAAMVFTMLPDGPEVEEVVLGTNGILEGCQLGSLIIDMSSINPLVSLKIAAAGASRDVDFLDAPVSGGEPKAIEGTLAMLLLFVCGLVFVHHFEQRGFAHIGNVDFRNNRVQSGGNMEGKEVRFGIGSSPQWLHPTRPRDQTTQWTTATPHSAAWFCW